jgi:hypothetical protein
MMSQGEAVLMRQGHPAAHGALTLETFSRYPLVTISLGGY